MIAPSPEIEIPTPTDIEVLAVHAGISVAEACRRADVSPEVFTRWRKGTNHPSIEIVRRIVAELTKARAAADVSALDGRD